VESDVGTGTTFTVDLPAALSPGDPTAVPEEPEADAAAPKTRGTVLYIEDNLANLRLFERIVAGVPASRCSRPSRDAAVSISREATGRG